MLGQVVPGVYAVREQETEKEVVPMVHRATTVMVHYSLRMMVLAVTPVVSFEHNLSLKRIRVIQNKI